MHEHEYYPLDCYLIQNYTTLEDGKIDVMVDMFFLSFDHIYFSYIMKLVFKMFSKEYLQIWL